MARSPLPHLVLSEWEDSRLYLQLVCQIVGKTRLNLHPFMNHWWHVPLYLSARGATTGGIPYRGGEVEVELDVFVPNVTLRRNADHSKIELRGQPIAEFYRDYRAGLKSLGVELTMIPKPYHCKSSVPFADDFEHTSFDPRAVQGAWAALALADAALKEFRSSFVGKCSPVHLFWHSFDLACTRFSGRRAPPMDDADAVTREAYSHEVISAGFWFGDDTLPEAAFYAYASPSPAGLANQPLSPVEAGWEMPRGSPMAILRYEQVRKAEDSKAMILDFFRSSYSSGANLAGWDRAALER